MTTQKTELSEELQKQLEIINTEIAQFAEDELFHQAIARLDMILGQIPDSDDYRLMRGALCARRAELLLDLEEDEDAWDWAQKAMNAGWYDASVYSIAGWAMYHLEDYDRALEQFNSAVELDPDRVASLTGRALVYVELEDFDSSRVDLSRVITLDPDNAGAYATRAELGVYVGTPQTARRDIAKARELDPEDPDYSLLHARLLTADGASAEALKILEKTIDEENPSLEALLLRSLLRFVSDDVEKARKDAMQASNNYPDEAFAFVMLASVQLAQNNTALALKAAERAVKLDPSLPDAYMMRYEALKARGDTELAQEDFDRAGDEPTELFMFLLGPCYDLVDTSLFADFFHDTARPEASVSEASQQATGGPTPPPGDAPKMPFPGMPGMPGFGGLGGAGPFGLDPMKMLGQVFDDEGNVRPSFKPILKLAMRNAPALLKTVPPHMLESMGGLDPEQLENFDPSDLSEEELEAQMRLFYKMVKAGQNPLED